MLAGFVECFTVSRRDGIVTTSFDDHDMNAVGNMPVIFLVGMRGSGKTTLGRALADKLGWLFADTDEMLCARCGRTVSEIVQEEGWGGFRKREAALLHDVARPYTVVETGLCCYLQAPADLLARRLRDDPKAAQRPALKAGIETLVGGDPLRAEIVALLRERDGLYQKAAHRRLNVNQPLERVFAALEETAREFVRKCRENERPDEAARVVQ